VTAPIRRAMMAEQKTAELCAYPNGLSLFKGTLFEVLQRWYRFGEEERRKHFIRYEAKNLRGDEIDKLKSE
jgi:hypothetical protein